MMLRVYPLIIVAATAVSLCGCACADEIQANLERERNFNAVQIIYRDGVPHTDKNGRTLMKYDPERSFMQIGSWGAPLGTVWGTEYDWGVLKEAGFNTVWPWPKPAETLLEAGKKHDLQIVLMHELDEATLESIKDNPFVLGNVWKDEPIGGVGSIDMDKLFGEFMDYREKAKKIAPDLNIFINDAPWIMPPAATWWVKWNTAGDVSCHDNYPIMDHSKRAESIGSDPNGIPQSIALAVAANKEKKPVWLIVGAFDQPGEYGQSFPFRYATPEQLRACVYAGIIHGATGIIYFIWDSYVSRDGGCIGMSPNPKATYTPNPQQSGYTKPTPASPMQLAKARALWEAAAQINTELKELTPAIFSPTVGPEFSYKVKVVGKSPNPTPIRTLLKPAPDGGYILLTVNLDDAVLKTTYEFPKDIVAAHVLYENRIPETIEKGTKTLTLTYEPFDTHIISIKLAP